MSSISNASSQIQQMIQDEKQFEVQSKNASKVSKAKESLKKTLFQAELACKTGKKEGGEQKPMSPQQAYVLAMAQLMEDNQDQMEQHVDRMKNLSPQMDQAEASLAAYSKQEGKICTEDPSNAATDQATLNANLTMLNTKITNIGTQNSQESSSLTNESSIDSAAAGVTQMMINAVIAKQGNYRG